MAPWKVAASEITRNMTAPPVGNDVVDLGEPETRLERLHPRFLNRVFTESERCAIRSSRNPRTMLWSHWAAKESVFKAAKKLRPDLVFSHSAIVADNWRPARGGGQRAHVSCDGRSFVVDVCRQEDWLHAVALPHMEDNHRGELLESIRRISPGADPSVAVRDLACQRIAHALGCKMERLAVAGSRPPRLLHDHESTFVDLSLSHHGRWVAFAAMLPG